MNARSEAKIEVLEIMNREISDRAGPDNSMAVLAMSMQTLASIAMYEEKLDSKMGNVTALLTALEEGNFTDENGSSLTDTLTFQNLKKRLVNEAE